MRTVSIQLTVNVTLQLPDGGSVEDAISDLDYEFKSGRGSVSTEVEAYDEVRVVKDLKIGKKLLADLEEILQRTTGLSDEPDVIETFTVWLDDGIEVDLKVCNGSEDSGPYVDAVLFHSGSEACVLEVSDTLLGSYLFYYNGTTYIVHVSEVEG